MVRDSHALEHMKKVLDAGGFSATRYLNERIFAQSGGDGTVKKMPVPDWWLVYEPPMELEEAIDDLFDKNVPPKKRVRGWAVDVEGKPTLNGRRCCAATVEANRMEVVRPDSKIEIGMMVECPYCGSIYRYEVRE